MSSNLTHTVFAMKKLVLYSLGFTGFILVIGLLFIYGVFNFSEGKAELIQTMHSSHEMNLHNSIVENVHDIGNLMTESFDINNAFEIKANVEKINAKKDNLNLIVENGEFITKQEQLKTSFYNVYKPALEAWTDKATKTIEEMTTEGVEQPPNAETMKSIFKNAVQAEYQLYIEAHNEFTEILNKARKY